MSRPEEILRYIEKPKTIAQIMSRFDIAESTARRYLRRPEVKGKFELVKGKFVAVGASSAHAEPEAKPEPKPKAKLVTLPEELVKSIMNRPKTTEFIEQKFGIPLGVIDQSNLAKDIHRLQTGTVTYLVIWSELPTSSHLEYKGDIFNRQGGSTVWKMLSANTTKRYKWENI